MLLKDLHRVREDIAAIGSKVEQVYYGSGSEQVRNELVEEVDRLIEVLKQHGKNADVDQDRTPRFQVGRKEIIGKIEAKKRQYLQNKEYLWSVMTQVAALEETVAILKKNLS